MKCSYSLLFFYFLLAHCATSFKKCNSSAYLKKFGADFFQGRWKVQASNDFRLKNPLYVDIEDRSNVHIVAHCTQGWSTKTLYRLGKYKIEHLDNLTRTGTVRVVLFPAVSTMVSFAGVVFSDPTLETKCYQVSFEDAAVYTVTVESRDSILIESNEHYHRFYYLERCFLHKNINSHRSLNVNIEEVVVSSLVAWILSGLMYLHSN